MIIVAIDPGREKCGLALATKSAVLRRQVVGRGQYLAVLKDLLAEYDIERIVVGDRTGSQDFRQEIRALFPSVVVETVDEHLSSDEARKRYWQEHPPQGWRRFLPTTMQVPPVPFDDYVAVILAERFFAEGPSNLV